MARGVFGVMTGTPEEHRVGYLTETLPVSEKLLALAGSAKPTQLFRIAAPCAGASGGCKHFKGNACSLAERIVAGTPVVVNALPAVPDQIHLPLVSSGRQRGLLPLSAGHDG